MYIEDPAPFVAALSRNLAKPGPSSLSWPRTQPNLAARPALMGDWKGALAAFETERQINGLGVDTRGDTVEGLTEIFADVGIEKVAWYGVRLFTDGWTLDRPATDLEADVLAVELEASRRDPYRQMSRLFHLVGRKTAKPS